MANDDNNNLTIMKKWVQLEQNDDIRASIQKEEILRLIRTQKAKMQPRREIIFPITPQNRSTPKGPHLEPDTTIFT
jgi:hypothetical protein